MKPTKSVPIGAILIMVAASFLVSKAAAKVRFNDWLAQQTANWTPSTAGTGPTITFQRGHMWQNYPANSTPDPQNISAMYTPNFQLEGDFDAQVDFRIDHYDPVPGFPVSGLRVQLAFNMTSAERVGWENLGYDVYLANHYWNFSTVATHDLSGTLRLVRQDGRVSSYYKSNETWKLIRSSPLQSQDLGPVRVTLSSGFPGYAFPGVAMKVAFSNFRVIADKIIGLKNGPRDPFRETPAAIREKNGAVPVQTVPQSIEGMNAESTVAGTPATPAVAGVPPGLEIKLAPALSLTGDVGSNYRIEYTEALGATNAWFDLAVITLTNNPQIYFDSSAIGQPARFYRLAKVP